MRWWRRAAFAAWTVAGGALAGVVALLALPAGGSGHVVATVPPVAPRAAAHARVLGDAENVARHNLFRPDRRSVGTRFSVEPADAPPAAPVTRPTLRLTGVALGTDPSAVIEGFPGVEGARVVRTGDVVAGLTVRAIGPSRVVVIGLDTTWILTFPWP